MLDVAATGGIAALGQTLRDNAPILLAMAAAVGAAGLVMRLVAGASRVGASSRGTQSQGLMARIGTVLVAAFTSNWQLTLLATTALVLSLASGWTTWDGMRNFTGEPLLSFMVTFGIQGVMLIIAWLIGESFAAGMTRSSRRGDDRRPQGFWASIEPLVGMLVGTLLAVALLTAVANAIGAFDDLRAASSDPRSWSSFANKALYLGVGLLLVATLLINQRSDVIQPYVQSARVIARNAVLWVMFLSCMATSVFFSFDSLFSSIFPADERRRAADIRASRQVAGVVNDIGALAMKRQAEEAEQLFKSPGWAAYEKNLVGLSRASQGAEEAIERFFVERMEAHKTAMAAQQERIATARSGQAGLASRKAALADELTRLKGERPGLAAELSERKTELETRIKNLDLKRVEAMAEEKGAEGTLKVGKGPVYRQRMAELSQQQDAVKIQEERVRDAQKRQAAADSRIAQLERELAAVDGDMAKLKGEAETAVQRITVAEAQRSTSDDTPKVDPARVRSAFERAVSEFRQDPTAERLNALSGQCTQLLNAMLSTPATKDRVRAIECDPKPAAEAAGRVFALNQGLVTFAGNCAGGAKLPEAGGIDALLSFGKKCLQDSGLPSKDAGDMAGRIASIDLNRDDKAHRFVVTWNAFADGNRLAYLALAIAIAIDSLVFMSGLFGANAMRSPLTDIEDRGAMTADQLEATIDAALHDTAHPRQTLSALLRSLHPISGHGDYTSEIILDEHDPLVGEMRQVLAMGITIGAVKRLGDNRAHYLLHSGLVRYFAVALSKSWKVKAADVDKKELVNVIGVALLPDPQANAEIVLGEMHPISDAEGFAAETAPFKIQDPATRRLVMNTLGAGATVPGAVRRNNEDGRYFVSTDFYKTLLLMRAAAIPAFRPDVVGARYAARQIAPPAAASAAAHLRSESVPQLSPPGRGNEAGQPGARAASPGNAHSPVSPQPAPSAVGTSVPIVPAGQAPASPPPVPPPARQPEPHAAMPRLIGAMQEASLGDEIRAEIIQLAGLHAWSEREIERARQLGADSGPEQALKRLALRAPRLSRLVGDAINDDRNSLQGAYEELRIRHEGDAMYNQVLETVASQLYTLLPTLMLTPNGPYQQILENMLIRSLEDQAGEGKLSSADEILLNRARAQVAAIKGLADDAPDRYARIARIVDQYDERAADGFVDQTPPRSSAV